MTSASHTEELHPALRQFLLDLRSLTAGSTPSVFWERQLEAFKATYARIEELSPTELDELVSAGSYGFTELDEGLSGPEDDKGFRRAKREIPRASKLGKQLSAAGMGLDKEDWEHLRAVDFLRRADLLDEYLSFLRPLRLRSDMSTARHWYYARQIVGLCHEHLGRRPLDVLEIGAGAGNLAYMLTLMGLVRSYTIIDLPQMLVHSSYTLQRRIRGIDLGFDATSNDHGTYRFLTDFRAADLLEGERFDLALNLNSFMEMDRETRDGYIELIYRHARPGALFYNLNRRQPALPLRDGGTWDNNPLLYPYRTDDRILVWEEDPFQTITRTKWGARPTLTVTRAAVVKPQTAG